MKRQTKVKVAFNIVKIIKTGARNTASIVSGGFSYHISDTQSGLHLLLKRGKFPDVRRLPQGFIQTTEYVISHCLCFSSHNCLKLPLFPQLHMDVRRRQLVILRFSSKQKAVLCEVCSYIPWNVFSSMLHLPQNAKKTNMLFK